MQNSSPNSLEAEVPFGFHELFFSRTDMRGRIASGNRVFQRVSGFGWEELAAQPHNVIRHADMPRGVFRVMWDRIRQGLPTGAYVKNRSKDGRHYWVYAIVTMIESGFLSVRLKPSTPIFDTVRTVYEKLRRLEAHEGLAPKESAERLLAELRLLGFQDYDAFMATTILAEFAARDRVLDRRGVAAFECFEELNQGAERLRMSAAEISAAYFDYRFVPTNLVVHAGKLGAEGAAMGAISMNYASLSREIETALATFVASATAVSQAVRTGAFLVGTAAVQAEMAETFDREGAERGLAHDADLTLLVAQQASFRERAYAGLTDVRRRVDDFARTAGDMRRLATGLAAIRVMGKVEAGRLRTQAVSNLITDLDDFQSKVTDALEEISVINGTMAERTRTLLGSYGSDACRTGHRSAL